MPDTKSSVAGAENPCQAPQLSRRAPIFNCRQRYWNLAILGKISCQSPVAAVGNVVRGNECRVPCPRLRGHVGGIMPMRTTGHGTERSPPPSHPPPIRPIIHAHEKP